MLCHYKEQKNSANASTRIVVRDVSKILRTKISKWVWEYLHKHIFNKLPFELAAQPHSNTTYVTEIAVACNSLYALYNSSCVEWTWTMVGDYRIKTTLATKCNALWFHGTTFCLLLSLHREQYSCVNNLCDRESIREIYHTYKTYYASGVI